MTQLLLLFILAHFAADFVFQGNRIMKLKKTAIHKGLFRHFLIHFLAASLAGWIHLMVIGAITDLAMIVTLIMAAFAVSTVHYLIDWLKEWLEQKSENVFFSAFLFLLDQAIHVLSIIVILQGLGLLTYSSEAWMQDILALLFGGLTLSQSDQLLLLLILLILVTQGAGYFLGILLRDLGPTPTLDKGTYSITDEKTEIRSRHGEQGEESKEIVTVRTERVYRDSRKQVGRYIGMMERILIIIFLVQGTPQGMMFLIAVKSLARFKQFESKEFAEYYLIGSLASALIAFGFGFVVLQLLG
jgi:hypothetical protein